MACYLLNISIRHDIDTGDRHLTDIDLSQQAGMGSIASNAFGEHYLFAVNRNAFDHTDASTVFRSYYGDSLFQEDRFYVIAGTDSGLLYQYVKTQGVPKGSRYLFVELPQVLTLLEGMDGPQGELALSTNEDWLEKANEIGILNYLLLNRVILLRSLGVVHGHYSDYSPFWRKLKNEFDTFAWEQKMALGHRAFIVCQIENLTENQVPAICLRDSFKGKTAVLLSGGPSLDDILPWVQQHRRSLLVIAVSRIGGPLLKAGIQPDIIVSIDPQPINLKVSQDILQFQDGTLLVNEFHLSANLLSSWGGQKVYMGPRYPWTTPLQPENLPPAGGATVTDTAFAIAMETGVAQIVLGGADFCFSQKGYTHASGSAEHSMGSMPQLSDQQVETNSGMVADTLNAYLQSAMSVDLLAKNAKTRNCRTINPAPGAIRLPHVEHLSLDAILVQHLERPARSILADCVPVVDASSLTHLYKEELNEVDRMLIELRTINKLSNKALIYNRKLFAKGEPGAGFHNKEKVERIEKELNTKHSDTATFIRLFGVTHFIPILGLDDNKYVEDLEESCRLYHQAFVDTSDELIELLRSARARILCRLEEEKAQPNLKRLLEQWHHDQQPGRAMQWSQRHASYVEKLPSGQQEALHEFENTFYEIIEELDRQYTLGIKRSALLEGITGNAQEYFLCHDQEGLRRLLATLQTHHDQEQALLFIPLVQAFIAELKNEPETAIKAYQSISHGPALLDALMRQFDIYTKAKDFDAALEVLKSLSKINTVYSPMYADLLQATGEIDTAVDVYTDYLLANPDDLDTTMKLGKLFLEHGVIDGVKLTMSFILDKDPNNLAAQKILSEVEPIANTGPALL